MKKLLPLVMMLLVLVSCSKSEYVSVIPKDAGFVMSVNMKSIAEKADFANSSLYPQFVDLLKGMAGSAAEQVQSYIEDPGQTGIDFREPLYVFQSADMLAMAMAVEDKGDLEDMIETMQKEGVCGEIEDADGFSFVKSSFGGYFAFNKNTLLIVAPSKGTGTPQYCQQYCRQLFSLEKEDCFVESEAFSQLDGLDGDIVFYGDLGSLSESTMGELKSLLPEGVRYSDVQVFSSFLAEQGRAVWSSRLKGKTGNVQKLIEEGSGNLQHIDGKFVESPMQDFSVWASAGVEKGALLAMLKQSNTGRQMLLMIERAIDVEHILREVEGDVVVVMPPAAADYKNPEFLLLAEVDDDDFMEDVDYWQKSMKDYGMSMTKTIGQNYLISSGDISINWGLDDENVYFATPQMFAKNSMSTRSDILRAYRDEIEDSYFYVYVNVPALLSSGKAAKRVGVLSTDKALEDLKSIIVQSKEHDRMDIFFNLSDQSQNFLKALFQ